MHDIDRVQPGADEFEAEAGEYRQIGKFGRGGPEPPVQEAQELEFASQLLELSDEQELEQFLGDVFRAAGNAVGRFARPETGQALGGILKDAVGRVLPLASGAHGDLAQQAASLLGLELEGLSPPEREFATARQLVRLAGHAYRHAAWAPRPMSPGATARMAMTRAARRYTPGLLRSPGRSRSEYGRSRWPGYSLAYPPTGGSRQSGGYWRGDSRRPQRIRQWPGSAWGYPAQPYGTGDDAGGDAPDGYPPPPDPVVVPAPPAVFIPPPAVPVPSLAVPAPPADPAPAAAGASPAAPAPDSGSSGELGSFGPRDTGPHQSGSRGGRWERHGSVLIVYGI